MALQVWLPLINDLQNYGLATVTVTNNGATSDSTNGKLGKCYYFNGSSYIHITMPSNMYSIRNSSVCMWVKSTGSTAGCGGISHDTDASKACVTLFGNSWQFASGSTWKYLGAGSYTNTSVWHHLACTIDDTTIRTYMDGVQIATNTLTGLEVGATEITSSNFLEIGCDHPGGNEFLTGYVNDFRVYDHCLSKKEVKEISKALAVHYPLANNGLGFPNMVDNSGTFNGWSIGSGWTKVTTDDGSIGYQFTRTGATSNNWVRIIPTLKIDGNNYPNGITVSMDLLTPDKSVINQKCLGSLQQYNSEGSRTGWYEPGWDLTNVVNGKWSRVSFFFTQSALLTNSQGLVYSYTQFSFQLVQNGDITIRRIKVEAGNKKTPYSISEADDINTTVEYDASGYKNNGTRGGTITISDNTPRNTCSTVFDGTTSGIEISSSIFPIVLNGPFTVSMWVYDAETGGRSIFFGNYSLTGSFFNIEKEGSNKARFYWNANPDFHCSNSPIASNAWTHLVMTRNGDTVKCYINGVLKDTSTTTLSGTIPTNATVFRLGRDGRSDATMFKGQMSDFRLYATVLTADDILQLYNTPISLNKHSLITNGEYIES